MSRSPRFGSLGVGTAVMVLVAVAVLSSGVIARAATPERCAVAPAGMSQDAPANRPLRGFCRCGCSFTPDCNTSADCGGGVCSKAPSCC